MTFAFILSAIGLVSGILTIYLFVKDLPLVTRTLATIRAPYWVWRLRFFERVGITTLPLVGTPQEHREVERFLYALHGYYKRLGIASPYVGQIGTSGQFAHKPQVLATDFIAEARAALAGRVSAEIYPGIDVILELWSPYLCGYIDSRIFEVIQISILVQLGYSVPVGTKQPLVKVVRDFFLAKYFDERKRNLKYFVDMEQSLSRIIAPTSRPSYYREYSLLSRKFSNDTNFQGFLALVELLHDTVELI